MSIPFGRSRILAALSLCWLADAALAQTPSQALFLPISKGVVRVEVERGDARRAFGSGVTVAPSVIATSCHVVRDAVSIRIAGSGATWDVDGEAADTRRDLCFLRVPTWRGAPVTLAASDALLVGESVVALGFTGGVAISPRLGQVRALHAFDHGRIIEADARFNSGSSGGGLFDAAGELVGILTFRLRNSVDSYYSVPVKWIRDGLPSAEQWTHVEPLRGALAFWQGSGEDLPPFMR